MKTTNKETKPNLNRIRKQVAAIAKKDLRIKTLEIRSLGANDVHELAVWDIEKALIRAYVAGRNSVR